MQRAGRRWRGSRVFMSMFLAAVLVSCSGPAVVVNLVDQTAENPIADGVVIEVVGEDGSSTLLRFNDLAATGSTSGLSNPSKVMTLRLIDQGESSLVTMRSIGGVSPDPSLLITVDDDNYWITWGSPGDAPMGNVERENPIRKARELASALAASALAVVEPYLAALTKGMDAYDTAWKKAAGGLDKTLPWSTAKSFYAAYAKYFRQLNSMYEPLLNSVEGVAEDRDIRELVSAAVTYSSMLYGCFHGADGVSQPSPSACVGLRYSLKADLEAVIAAVRNKVL